MHKENRSARWRNPAPSANSRFRPMVCTLQWGAWTLKVEATSGSPTSNETPLRDSHLDREPHPPVPSGLRTAVASSFDPTVQVCTTSMKSQLRAPMTKRSYWHPRTENSQQVGLTTV